MHTPEITERRLLDMLESLLAITEQFTEGEIRFDDGAMKEWYRISAETADLRASQDNPELFLKCHPHLKETK